MSDPVAVPIETVLLERMTAAASVVLTREFAEDAEVSVRAAPWAAEHLVVQIKQAIWGRRVGERLVEYPADWWEAAKERWFPRWALRRWPVRRRSILIEARDVFPQVVTPPGGRRTVTYRWASL